MSNKTDAQSTVIEAMAQARDMVDAERVDQEQLDLLEPVSPEEMQEAQQDLGAHAGNVSVLKHARAKKRGRPAGSKNKRTDDFARYLLSHGQHPAVTMMQIQTTPPEILVERSLKMDPEKRRMTYGDAQALRVRCAEGLLPYIESKKPVAVDATIRGVMVQEQIGEIGGAGGVIIDGEPLGVLPGHDRGDDQ